jgi:tRNA G18 (ribose-2'-O)-methylase SpoU
MLQLVVKVKPEQPAPVGDHEDRSIRLRAHGEVRLLLDNWRSLFNVGSAFRTADGAGVHHLYLCGITATPSQQVKLAKTALGAEVHVAWSYHADAVTLAAELQDAGAQVWVLERNASSRCLFDITSLPRATPVVLAAGNEVLGVDPGMVALADRVIHLPMLGSKRSLNVAVALSIATYWLRAQPSAIDVEQQV